MIDACCNDHQTVNNNNNIITNNNRLHDKLLLLLFSIERESVMFFFCRFWSSKSIEYQRHLFMLLCVSKVLFLCLCASVCWSSWVGLGGYLPCLFFEHPKMGGSQNNSSTYLLLTLHLRSTQDLHSHHSPSIHPWSTQHLLTIHPPTSPPFHHHLTTTHPTHYPPKLEQCFNLISRLKPRNTEQLLGNLEPLLGIEQNFCCWSGDDEGVCWWHFPELRLTLWKRFYALFFFFGLWSFIKKKMYLRVFWYLLAWIIFGQIILKNWFQFKTFIIIIDFVVVVVATKFIQHNK